MRNRPIGKIFTVFILFIFCIAGIYRSYDMADSFFRCENNADASLYEQSFVDHTQDAILENSSSITQLLCSRKENDTDTYRFDSVFCDSENLSDTLSDYSDVKITKIVQESCIDHFCTSVITNYIHQKDGEKIA